MSGSGSSNGDTKLGDSQEPEDLQSLMEQLPMHVSSSCGQNCSNKGFPVSLPPGKFTAFHFRALSFPVPYCQTHKWQLLLYPLKGGIEGDQYELLDYNTSL